MVPLKLFGREVQSRQDVFCDVALRAGDCVFMYAHHVVIICVGIGTGLREEVCLPAGMVSDNENKSIV
jgi:hypothetical protein